MGKQVFLKQNWFQMVGRPVGLPKTGGRKKGTVNRTTASAKEAFALAFDRLGGEEGLATWAAENQTDFYKLYSKLIPTDVNNSLSLADPVKELLDSIGSSGRPRPA